MDALKLLQLRQAQTRLEYAQKQTAKTQAAAGEYRYLGYDAERGKAILSNGIDEISGDRITNGAIKPNQPVRVTQAGNRVVVDAMPRPKPKPSQPTPTERGKIKVLLSKLEGDEQIFYIAGDRPKPYRLTQLPRGAAATYARIDNLGRGNRWIVSIQYSLGGRLIARTLESGSQVEIDIPGGTAPDIIRHGYGFWEVFSQSGALYYALDRGQIIATSPVSREPSFSYNKSIAPGLIKPVLWTRLNNVIGNPWVIQSDYVSIYVGRGEAVYTYQTSGIVPQPSYWQAGTLNNPETNLEVEIPSEVDQNSLLNFAPPNLVFGVLYWLGLSNPYRTSKQTVLQFDFKTSTLTQSQHQLFALPNNPSINGISTYSFWGYSFHPN